MKFYIFFFFPKLASNKHQSLQYQALCWTLESGMKDKTLAWINVFFKKIYVFAWINVFFKKIYVFACTRS